VAVGDGELEDDDEEERDPATLSVAGLSTLPEQPATRARPATTVATTASRAPEVLPTTCAPVLCAGVAPCA
jgi:hypothetical protein